MSKRVAISWIVAIVLCSIAASAQMAPPKPAPELKRLDYFLGTWTLQGDMKPSEFGPAGKLTETQRNEWMQGGLFLIGHADFTGATGEGNELAFYGYNPDDKVYTYDAFNSWGESVHARGSVSGDTWTWQSESKMMGKTMQSRFSVTVLSPTSYSFKFDMGGADGAWKTVMDGTATKNK